MSDTKVTPGPGKDKAAWDRVLMRAATDSSFREDLITKPNETLLSYGIEIPPNVRITVHEFDPNHQHIFLPPLGSSVAKPGLTIRPATSEENKGGNNG